MVTMPEQNRPSFKITFLFEDMKSFSVAHIRLCSMPHVRKPISEKTLTITFLR